MSEGLRARVRERQPASFELLRRLVAIDTSNPPGRGYAECVGALREHLAGEGVACRLIEVDGAPPERPRYLLRAEIGEGRDRLYLHGHYDVVPAAPEQFEPEVRDGRLYGRGSGDMKGGLVAKIAAALALRDAGLVGEGRLVLHFVPDEETGGALGSAALAAGGHIDSQAAGMLLGEPTGGVVWHGHKGALSAQVRVRGATAHVGLPHAGINAVLGAVPLLRAAQSFAEELGQRTTDLSISPPQAARSAVVVGGRVEGPSAANAVPDHFGFSIDCRFNPEDDLGDIEQRLRETLAAAAGTVRYEVDIFQRAAPSLTAVDTAAAVELGRAVEAVTGEAARFEICPGVLESRFYAAAGVPALAYGPGNLALAHGPREYVVLDEVMRSAEVYALTAARLLDR